jgi:hypothetical protein
MPASLVRMRGEKVARTVIGRAAREVELAFARGEIGPEVYRLRMAGIAAERAALEPRDRAEDARVERLYEERLGEAWAAAGMLA